MSDADGPVRYTSWETVESATAGVTYTVAKMSFARRVELTRRIRDLAARQEFLAAGEAPNEKMEAAILAAEIDRIYLLWGLKEVNGLEVDGSPATPELLVANGPEELVREALAAVKGSAAWRRPKEKTNGRTPL